jgi:hypothetical protein
MLSESKYIEEFSDIYLISCFGYVSMFVISISKFKIIKIVKILFFLESDNFLKQKN